jgi:hypothetical protein
LGDSGDSVDVSAVRSFVTGDDAGSAAFVQPSGGLVGVPVSEGASDPCHAALLALGCYDTGPLAVVEVEGADLGVAHRVSGGLATAVTAPGCPPAALVHDGSGVGDVTNRCLSVETMTSQQMWSPSQTYCANAVVPGGGGGGLLGTSEGCSGTAGPALPWLVLLALARRRPRRGGSSG